MSQHFGKLAACVKHWWRWGKSVTSLTCNHCQGFCKLQIPCCYPKYAFHCTILISPPEFLIYNFSLEHSTPIIIRNSTKTQPSNH